VVNSLPQRLTYKRPLDRAGLYQVKNRSQRPSVFVARSGLNFALEQVAIMEHDNARDIAVTPEVCRNGHMELGRVQVRQLIEAQRRLMTIDAIDLFLSVPRPERPKYKIGPIRCREQRQTVDAAVFPDPVPGLYVVRMRIFGKSGRLGLLRGEEALLLLGEIEEPPRRLSVRLGHCTILQLSCCFVSHENWRPSHPRKLRSRQGCAFSALFPEIRDLPTMKGLLDLERQGYAFKHSSGKTTLMKACLDHVPMSDRLIVIEQVAELRILKPNAVRWEAVDAIPGQVAVLPSALLAAALRHRPDRIIFGEIRDECANDLLQAMNTGHGGTLTTLHAKSAWDTLSRLSNLALSARPNINHSFIRSETAEAINFVLYCERLPNGKRRVRELIEVKEYDFATQSFLMDDLYRAVDNPAPPL